MHPAGTGRLSGVGFSEPQISCTQVCTVQIRSGLQSLYSRGTQEGHDPFQDFVPTSAHNYVISSIIMHLGHLYKHQLQTQTAGVS